MKARLLLPIALLLAGCDKLTGAADQKIADAEAIGFACRVSHKTPEDCMKENEAQPPSSILDGWKAADEEIKEGKLDPAMSNAAVRKEGEAADGEKKPAEGEPAKETKEEKPAEGAKETKTVKPETSKIEEGKQKAARPETPGETKTAESKEKVAH